MATGGAAEVLEKIGERHLECSICFNRFAEPKVLDCLHTFCLNCLQNLRQGEDPQGVKLKCPLCRHETILGINGVKDLPTNLTLSALVEEFAVQEQLFDVQESEIKCQSCDEKYPAISFCMECPHFLCLNCKSTHERLPGTKSHKTVTIAQLRSGEVAYKSTLREKPKCGNHSDSDLNIYCNKCKKLMCIKCSVPNHRCSMNYSCPSSDVVLVSEAFNTCKKEIENMVAQSEKKIIAMTNVKKMIRNSRKKLDVMFESTNKKISQKADKEVARIRETEQKLKKDAEKIYEDRVLTFETTENTNNEELKVAQQTLDEVNKIMKEEIQTQILDLKEKLLHNLKYLMEKQPENVPDKLHFIDFQEGDKKSLGRLNLEDKWRLGTEKTSDRITSVAVFSNNEMVAINSAHKLITYSPTSNPLPTIMWQKLQIPDLKNPQKVAVNRLDQLIVLDSPLVKTFSEEYHLLRQFQPGRGSDSKPTCLAVDDNNLIAVGYKDKQEISLHKPDGSLVERLSTPLIADQLAVSNRRFIFTNFKEKKMVSTTYTNTSTFTIDINSPRCICCDSQGNIYVADDIKHSLLDRTTGIHLLHPNGKYIERMPTQCPSSPQCMTFTPAGDIVLATRNSLQIYQRV